MKNHFPNSTIDINLSAIKTNVQRLKEKVPGKQYLAVVKCDAYSHGAVQLARLLEEEVDWFAVAAIDEGIEFRKANIAKPILVFGVPTAENAAAYQTHNLTATVSHLSHFSILMDGTSYQLNFDTGMGRLGFMPGQAEEVRKHAVMNQRLLCSGIYTHYATADDPGSEQAADQHRSFTELVRHFDEVPLKHISNSGGVLNYDFEHFDMVRFGIAMLGYNSGLTRYDWLTPALSWHTQIAQVRKVEKGHTVSYGATWRAPEDGYLATIPVGYGDGIPRSLSNKLKVAINGTLYPQVGNVTMDYIMVYLGNDRISPATEVTLLGGDALDAAEWSKLGGTNTHEILTNLKGRFVKNYLKGNG